MGSAAKSAMREQLLRGETIYGYREGGNSMVPLIYSGEPIDIRPVDREPRKGDIVFCKIGRKYYCHLVTGVKNGRYQISNNHGHVNGYTSRENIFGFITLSDRDK